MVYKRGWWCAWCQVPYHRESEKETKASWWIPCDFCFRFAHVRCERENDAKALSRKLYACPECRERKETPKQPMKQIGKVPRGAETKEIDGHIVYKRPFDHNSSAARALEKREALCSMINPTSRSGQCSLNDMKAPDTRSVSKMKNVVSVNKLIKKRVVPEKRKPKSIGLASLVSAAEHSAPILNEKKPERKQTGWTNKLDASLHMSLRPRAPKELAKEWAGREQQDEAPSAGQAPRRLRSGVRKKKAPSLFDARIDHDTLDYAHSGGVLFPWETGGMVGPLSQLGSLMGDVPKPRSSAPTSKSKRHRAPSRAHLSLSKSFGQQRLAATASLQVSEETALENIAQGIYKSLDPSFDKYTIHLNVCRLLHELTTNHANASIDLICKVGLNDLVRALLTSDDVIIRLSADALLRFPSWREAICGQSPTQQIDPAPLNLPSISTFSGLPSMGFTGFPSAEPTPVSHVVTRPIPQRPRCPREAQEAFARAAALGTSTSSPTETITPPQSQPQASLPLPFFQIPNITSQGADTEAEDALLFSASQDVPSRRMS